MEIPENLALFSSQIGRVTPFVTPLAMPEVIFWIHYFSASMNNKIIRHHFSNNT